MQRAFVALACLASFWTGLDAAFAQEPPLLGSSHAKFLWESWCEGRPDDAPLPPNPRSRIRPEAWRPRIDRFA